MGRQINFFMMPEDVAEFDAKVKGLGLNIISDRMPTCNPELYESIINPNKINYLLLSEDLPNISANYVSEQNTYWINFMQIPAIEFRKSIYKPEQKSITIGRLFIQNDYLNKENKSIPVSQKLTETSEKLFRWLKKQYTKKVDSYYLSNFTYDFSKTNQLTLRTYSKDLVLY